MASIKANQSGAPALLPILSKDPNALEKSGLAPYSDPVELSDDYNEQESEKAAHLLNPDGPWHLRGTIRVPLQHVHISLKQYSSPIHIRHALKIFIRVERGDDTAVDSKGHRKQYDIIVETPITILSVRPSRDTPLEERTNLRTSIIAELTGHCFHDTKWHQLSLPRMW